MKQSRFVRAIVATWVVALGAFSVGTASAESPGDPGLLPIVFVHGQSGSAAQFETQAMRFTSNGYPQELLYAFEYDTSPGMPNPIAALDAFLDEVIEATGAPAVNAVGHSRGTSVWTTYLDDPAFDGPDKVASYVNVDGATQPTEPGGVPTIGIWGEWNTSGSGFNRRGDTDAVIGDPENNFYFGGKSHTETMTSPEAFALMYEAFTGTPPATTDVVPEPPGLVSIAGRAVLFPENLGYAGASVELWRIDADTGQRIGARPRATAAIDDSGAWGPFDVNGTKHYELAVVRPEDGSVHHFYFEPFTRSDHFVRLNLARPGTGLEAFTPRSPERVNLVLVRQREFWGDQGASSDVLTADGTNVLNPVTSPRASVNLAMLTFDVGLDGVTDLTTVPFPFPFIAFITAADVAVDASADASGVVTVTEDPRGSGHTSTLNVPNWRSTDHRITVQFRDTDQAREAFPGPR